MAARHIGMGLVGAGFVGPHHIDAVRRLGFVDVVAVAGSNDASARAAAARLHVPVGYGSWAALLDDPRVDVVHIATPNAFHAPIAIAAIAAGKHVVSEKPLAMTAAEARDLCDAADRAGLVHAVTFNYRGNPLVQQAREMVACGEIGTPHFLHGRYLQDWLLQPADYSWRLERDVGGASSAFADIGSHWCDLAEHVSGLRIVRVLGEMSTVIRRRQKPTARRHAFESHDGDDRLDQGDTPADAPADGRADECADECADEWVDVEVEDLVSVLLRFDNGATGTLAVGQVCAGHKNDLALEICGATGSLAWRQERQNELWVGRRDRPNEVWSKDPSLMDASVRHYAQLPGGHQEGWADAFTNVVRDIYTSIAMHIGRGATDHIGDAGSAGASGPVGETAWASGTGQRPAARRPAALATFEDGYRAACIVEAVLASARAGGVWTTV